MNRLIHTRQAAAAIFAGTALLASAAATADVIEIGADGAVLVQAADRVAAPAERPSPAPAGAAASLYLPALKRIAERHAMSPALLEALVWQESRWHAGATSPKGAIGLSQLMPATARGLGVDPHDPLANLEGGARYLRQQLDRFGDIPSALAAYNAGPGVVIAAGGVPAIAETRGFVDAILGRLARAPHTPSPY